ncbi:chromosome segregation protein SMC [Idiomarina seosinensis]|uniref:chromosome segregation protein SMC n=1 Tax=Idiomarina seosinensis TaxID=281739 RepID=UPI00384AF5E3
MRLKHIKLVGFKSFVDPTKVPFPDQMTCVVGPNGCGKSNVIDAVRWVLGESSAKNLRGDAMSDVIFNGSASRKPVSQASVELVFDNSSGRIQGEFAAFKEISVKRQVTRDGQSNYFLNASKCRRRDITDLFLGTGLGPRSYAIIEQGMISRLIESKPQELRVFIEEAAGISKYKERRRETENRMKHTRENLERISDIREELGQQLDKLQRQAAAASRYKQLKASERQLRGELYGLRWLRLERKREQLQQQLEQQKTELERLKTEHSGDEQGIAAYQQQAGQLKIAVEEAQHQVFLLANQITRLEQSQQHQRQLSEQRQQRQQQLQQDLEELQHQQDEDSQQLQQLAEQEEELALKAEHIEEQLLMQQEQLQSAEQQWQQQQSQQRELQLKQQQLQQQLREIELEQQRLQQQQDYADEQRQQLQQNLAELEQTDLSDELEQLRQQIAEKEQALDIGKQQHSQQQRDLQQQQEQTQNQQQSYQHWQQEYQQHQARYQTLEQVLQSRQPVLSDANQQWLQQHQARPLREVLQVAQPWREALEKLLTPWLNSYWLDQPVAVEQVPEDISLLWPLSPIQQGSTSQLKRASEVVTGSAKHWPLLNYCVLADSLQEGYQALQRDDSLLFAVTRSGHWCSTGSLATDKVREDSVLQMQDQLQQLQRQYRLAKSEREAAELKLGDAQRQLETLQRQCEEAGQQCQALESSLSQQRQRAEFLQQQQSERQQRRADLQQRLEHLKQQTEHSAQQLQSLDSQQQKLQRQQQQQQLEQGSREQPEALEQHLRELQEQRQQWLSRQQQIQLQRQNLQTQQQQLSKLTQRYSQRRQALQAEAEELMQQQQQHQQIDEQEQLAELLGKREQADDHLLQVREQLAEVENQLHQLNQGRSQINDKISQAQQQLQATEIELAKQQERTHAALDSLSGVGLSLKQVLQDVDETANEDTLSQQLDKLTAQIKRLGAVNLAAIEEAKTQKERKDYLDTQYDDLCSALDTLEQAIRKIERETRQRFKTTFVAINRDLQVLFPKVFAGGHAELRLTDDDLLETGVTIMAQPPGKKNSTIHLLSGGEKALTALSLVFAIFRLNPAPFCLLDEVDAPLDDTNVARFCRLVDDMSGSVQFIYISHNKVAMEMASHLAGVTMQEAGVSRLVAVDIEQAVAMTEG